MAPKTEAKPLRQSDPVNPEPTVTSAVQVPVVDPNEGKTLRGYVIERPGANGEPSSWFKVGPGGGAWTWDKEEATRFTKREDAKPLIAKKKAGDEKGPARPAGVASNEGAKIVKFDEGSDDE